MSTTEEGVRRPALKFCGLTRAVDAARAAALGARYLGVVLAPSPRQVSIEAGCDVFAGGADLARVGVFAGWDADAVTRAAETLRLDVVQLHGQGDDQLVDTLRARLPVRIWDVVHIDAAAAPEDVAAAIERATPALQGDAVLLDARVEGMLGGTGRAFDWRGARAALSALARRGPIILAGGLTPENVARAIATLAPDVVDVSSGVEVSPGIKDPHRMRAFADAVHAAPGAPQP